MQLVLSRRTRARDLKRQFAFFFPFLKLEFFRERHACCQHSAPELMVAENTFVNSISACFREGVFLFAGDETVGGFEQRLQNEHGLPVQVFRKSGSTWLQTIHTDHLQLTEQNELSREASQRVHVNAHTLFL